MEVQFEPVEAGMQVELTFDFEIRLTVKM